MSDDIRITPSWAQTGYNPLALIDTLHRKLRCLSSQADTLRDSLHDCGSDELHVGAADAIYHGAEDLRAWLTEWEARQGNLAKIDCKKPMSPREGSEAGPQQGSEQSLQSP